MNEAAICVNHTAAPWTEHFSEKAGMHCYTKYLLDREDAPIYIKEVFYPRGFMTHWHKHSCSHGMYILNGTLKTNIGSFTAGQFVWWPAGTVAEHGAADDEDVTVLFITNGKFDLTYTEQPQESGDVFTCDVNEIPWNEVFNDRKQMSDFGKIFFTDPKTGMIVKMGKYPRGWMTDWHDHPCSHGMYVLKGLLKTSAGILGPGDFIWFPEGFIGEHGATAWSDVEFLFITDKPFDIHYLFA